MSRYRFRAANPRSWLVALIVITYGLVLTVVLLLDLEWITRVTGDVAILKILVITPLLLPLFGILWYLCPDREIQLTETKLTLTNGYDELTSIKFQDIARIRLTAPQNRLQIFNRQGERQIDVRSLSGSDPLKAVIAYLRVRLPHDMRRVRSRLILAPRTDTYIDFRAQPLESSPLL